MDQFQTSSFFQRWCLPIRSILVHILYYRLLKTYHNECAAYFVLGHFNFFQRKLKPILKFCTIYYALAFRFFFHVYLLLFISGCTTRYVAVEIRHVFNIFISCLITCKYFSAILQY